MEENKTLEMENLDQENIEETAVEENYEVMDPYGELNELAEREDEEPSGSSGALWMAAGAAVTVGAYVGGKWVYKKASNALKSWWSNRKAKKESDHEYVDDYDENNVVDGECEEVSEEETEKE